MSLEICPGCDGKGYTIVTGTGVGIDCCGYYVNGECCGMAIQVPVPEPAQAECILCQGAGEVSETLFHEYMLEHEETP